MTKITFRNKKSKEKYTLLFKEEKDYLNMFFMDEIISIKEPNFELDEYCRIAPDYESIAMDFISKGEVTEEGYLKADEF